MKKCDGCGKTETACPYGPAGRSGPKLFHKGSKMLCYTCLDEAMRSEYKMPEPRITYDHPPRGTANDRKRRQSADARKKEGFDLPRDRDTSDDGGYVQ